MNTKIYSLICIVLLFGGCTNKKSLPHTNATNYPDYEITTSVEFVTSTDKIKLVCSKLDSQYLSDFQNYLNYWSNKDHNLSKIDTIDITGDDIPEYCEVQIYQYGHNTTVINTIKTSTETIWADTMLIDDRFAYYLSSIDSLTFKSYQSLFTFYFAQKHFTRFVLEPNEHKNVIPIMLPMNTDGAYWEPYLSNFTGRLIRNLSPEDPSVFIWDNRSNKFTCYYSP